MGPHGDGSCHSIVPSHLAIQRIQMELPTSTYRANQVTWKREKHGVPLRKYEICCIRQTSAGIGDKMGPVRKHFPLVMGHSVAEAHSKARIPFEIDILDVPRFRRVVFYLRGIVKSVFSGMQKKIVGCHVSRVLFALEIGLHIVPRLHLPFQSFDPIFRCLLHSE